jgi:peptide/nickel transport system ATP-binding protein
MVRLLEVSNLEAEFPGAKAVRDLSFAVDKGETLALVGESGCGKSATALAVMGLLPAPGRITHGRILFDGADLAALPERHMRRLRGSAISMIFQDPMTSLNPVLRVGRQITETLRRHQGHSARAARARAIELLDLVRIPEPHRRIDDFPHQLSGGMRQRVMIAMATACGPRLLIADEPTTALDVTIQAQILELLSRLKRELSMALLLITHDLGVVAEHADRVVVMYAGRKAEEAPTAELFRTPLHPYTVGLLAASPRLDRSLHYREGRLDEIPGSVASAASETGCAFAPRCRHVRADCRVAPPATRRATGRHFAACLAAPAHPRETEPVHADA